jgi:hypothetical protein
MENKNNSVREWIKDIKNLSDNELIEYKKAFDKLHTWEKFHDAFKWTGTQQIEALLYSEICDRATKKQEVKTPASYSYDKKLKGDDIYNYILMRFGKEHAEKYKLKRRLSKHENRNFKG